MNILPKKRWHVRTRENIARVRRDEAAAAADEKTRKARAQKAETEARINFLREKTRARYNEQNEVMQDDEIQVQKEKFEHVNFFVDMEHGKIDHHKPNVAHEAEAKAEKEKYEQQIGYLTYLGQNINAAKNNTNWYDDLPERFIDKGSKKEIQGDKKLMADPITDIKRYISIMDSCRSKNQADIHLSQPSKKRAFKAEDKNTGMGEIDKLKRNIEEPKKRKLSELERSQSRKTKSHNISVGKLREARLSREKTEKLRTNALLAKVRGESIPFTKMEETKIVVGQKYNAQFFPEIARQNTAMTPRQR